MKLKTYYSDEIDKEFIERELEAIQNTWEAFDLEFEMINELEKLTNKYEIRN
jgi:hypothetical protein